MVTPREQTVESMEGRNSRVSHYGQPPKKGIVPPTKRLEATLDKLSSPVPASDLKAIMCKQDEQVSSRTDR